MACGEHQPVVDSKQRFQLAEAGSSAATAKAEALFRGYASKPGNEQILGKDERNARLGRKDVVKIARSTSTYE